MEKRAQIKHAGEQLRNTLRKVAEENLANQDIAVHNALVSAGYPDQPRAYKNAAFLQLIREVSDVIGLALEDE